VPTKEGTSSQERQKKRKEKDGLILLWSTEKEKNPMCGWEKKGRRSTSHRKKEERKGNGKIGRRQKERVRYTKKKRDFLYQRKRKGGGK